jgi:TolB protein
MKSLWSTFGALLVLSTSLWAQGGQEMDQLNIMVPPTVQRVQLAVPDVTVGAGADAQSIAAARTITEVLWYDLQYCGLFNMVKKDWYGYIPQSTDVAVKFDDWKGIGAQALVLAKVSPGEGGKLVLEGRLYDIEYARQRLGKRLQAQASQARLLAHSLADEIIRGYTGIPGVGNTEVIFVSDRDGSKDIFVMDYDGANQRKLTDVRSITLSPALSADGRSFAFSSVKRGDWDLFVAPRSGGKARALISGGGVNVSAVWSPEDSLIAFASTRGGNSDIYTVRPDGSDIRRLTNNAGIDTNPAWSPKGNEIAYTSTRRTSTQVWVMNGDGSNQRPLTKRGRFNDQPDFDPSGERLTFASRLGTGFDIFVLDLRTDQISRLTGDAGSNESPRFSPDGRHIVFASNRSGRYQIYLMELDGSGQRAITNTGNNSSPRWSRWYR